MSAMKKCCFIRDSLLNESEAGAELETGFVPSKNLKLVLGDPQHCNLSARV